MQVGTTAASLPGHGHRVIVNDLADDAAASALVEAAGDIDMLVANAALPGSGATAAPR